MENFHKYFHYFAGIVFLVVISIAICGQDANKGLTAGLPGGEGEQPPAQNDNNQTPTTPPKYEVQIIPQSFKPTSIPPGNNIAAPINIGSESQTKQGDLGINGNLILQGIILTVKAINAGEDVYGGYACTVESPWLPQGGTSDTCNGDAYGAYACGETESRQCTDIYFDNSCWSVEGINSGSMPLYNARQITCKINRILMQQQ